MIFTRKGEQLSVDITIDYIVKIAFVTVFRYRLRAREIWAGRTLVTASAKTDNNGKPEFMHLRRDEGGLFVEGSASRHRQVPATALLASHWNIAQLKAPMINPQDGGLLTFSVKARGEANVQDAAGRSRAARHFTLAGQTPLELWYDSDDVWTGLRAKVHDGSIVTYLRTT